jgi:hypothetical protein
MGETDKDFESDKHHAEVFDALGHPTRITILKALSEGSLGFADLKKMTGIQSNGHLQHHINKLNGLVKTDDYGKYCLSDQGKDALLPVGTVEDAANSIKRRRRRISTKKLVELLLIAIIVTASVSVWAFDRIEINKRWVNQFNESFDYALHMAQVGPLIYSYYNTSEDLQRFTLNNELYDASNSLLKIQDLERDGNSFLLLGKIRSFMSRLSNNDLNLTQLSTNERNDLANAAVKIGNLVVRSYGAIFNYTTVDPNYGPPFWYFGPSSPDQAELQEAAELAVSAQQIIS